MSHQPRSRNSARNLARGFQAATVVLAVAAGGVVAVGLPWMSAPTADSVRIKPAAATTTVGGGTETSADPMFEIDSVGVSERLSLVDNAPVPEVIAVDPSEAGPEEGPGDEQLQTPQAVEIAYLGSIREPTRNVALVVIDGRQKFLAAGDTADAAGSELELVEILPAKITIDMDGALREISKKKKSDQSVTMVSGTEINTMAMPEESNEPRRGRRQAASIEAGSLPRGSANMPEHIRERREQMQRAAEEGRLREFNQERIRNAENQELLTRPVTAPSSTISPTRRNGDGSNRN